jgi:hypothetical protein
VAVEPARLGDLDDAALLGRLGSPRLGAVHGERLVAAPEMLVLEEVGQDTAEMAPAEHDDVRQALAANAADQPLDVGRLPRAPRCCQHLMEAQVGCRAQPLPPAPVADESVLGTVFAVAPRLTLRFGCSMLLLDVRGVKCDS